VLLPDFMYQQHHVKEGTQGYSVKDGMMSMHRLLPDRLVVVLLDSGFLAFIVLVSLVLYVSRLGFYSDDWSLLATMDLADDSSVIKLITIMFRDHPEMRSRPVEVLHYVVLYKVFGVQSWGYHVVNSTVLMANAILLYICLLQFRSPRTLALSAVLIYILLPHYSTNRFWITASVVPLSMSFYFVSLYCDLRSLGTYGWRFAIWKAASAGALLGSTLGYETPLPLFFIIRF